MTDPNAFRADRFNAFSAAYLTGLIDAVVANPDDYTPNMVASVTGGSVSFGGVPAVHEKMMAALKTGSFNHDGKGFKNACKALGIKHTRNSILAFLKGV
jgi:hypothetical protein